MANKIIYGLSNAHVWKITGTDATGKPTYGTVIPIKGSVSISLDAQGDSNEFYADNIVFYQTIANQGYSGNIEIVDIPAAFETEILGLKTGTSGTIFEDTDVQPAEFALAFEFQGDQHPRRHLFYKCKCNRPSISSSTKTASIEPNTLQLELTVMAREDNHIVRAKCEQGDSDYANWYTTPVEPAFPTA